MNSENGKQNGQNKVKDKGKTEGSQSRNGRLEGREFWIWQSGGMGSHEALQRVTELLLQSWPMRNKERTKGNQRFFRNNDYKFVNASYLQAHLAHAWWTRYCIMNFPYFKSVLNHFHGFTYAWPISEIRAGNFHIKMQYVIPLSHSPSPARSDCWLTEIGTLTGESQDQVK